MTQTKRQRLVEEASYRLANVFHLDLSDYDAAEQALFEIAQPSSFDELCEYMTELELRSSRSYRGFVNQVIGQAQIHLTRQQRVIRRAVMEADITPISFAEMQDVSILSMEHPQRKGNVLLGSKSVDVQGVVVVRYKLRTSGGIVTRIATLHVKTWDWRRLEFELAGDFRLD